MAGLPTPRPPLDRAALERVLARAAELQGQSPGSDAAGMLTDEQILELGREVGLSVDALRQAIAEERAQLHVSRSRGASGWFGPDIVSAARVVPGTPESVLIAIDAVLRGDLPFDVKRRFPDRVHWEPRRSFIDAVRSQFLRGVEGVDLKLAQEVATAVTKVDAARTHVRIDAVLAETRRRAVGTSVNAVVIGSALALALPAFLGFGLFVVPLAAAAVLTGVFGVRRTYRRTVSRVTTAIEQVLDRLEFGPAKRRGAGLLEVSGPGEPSL